MNDPRGPIFRLALILLRLRPEFAGAGSCQAHIFEYPDHRYPPSHMRTQRRLNHAEAAHPHPGSAAGHIKHIRGNDSNVGMTIEVQNDSDEAITITSRTRNGDR